MSVLDLEMTHKKTRKTQLEHTMWLEDIGRWRGEHRRTAAKLAQVQSALMEHEAALESHAETVRAHELHMVRLERAIADEEIPKNIRQIFGTRLAMTSHGGEGVPERPVSVWTRASPARQKKGSRAFTVPLKGGGVQ